VPFYNIIIIRTQQDKITSRTYSATSV